VHRKPRIAERLHLEFRVVHQRDMTVDVSLLPQDDLCEPGAETPAAPLDRKWIASIASAARQVHGPTDPAVF